ncbi:MAG: hypothetical protein HOV81_28930 [Kofleriaceae bacterium]|nr:hypothetical protein [Kofleriaceae bacterium]
MAWHGEHNALVALLEREHARVLACLKDYAIGGVAHVLADAGHVLRALAAAETQILFPAFTRVTLRHDLQRLLDDARGRRAEQLTALDRLRSKRAPALRKLAALQLADGISEHGKELTHQLVPVLASQLPRPMYRSIVNAFATSYRWELEPARAAQGAPPARAVTREARRHSKSVRAQ